MFAGEIHPSQYKLASTQSNFVGTQNNVATTPLNELMQREWEGIWLGYFCFSFIVKLISDSVKNCIVACDR